MRYITLTLVGYNFYPRCALSFLIHRLPDKLSYYKIFRYCFDILTRLTTLGPSLIFVKQSCTARLLNMGRRGYPETSVNNHQPTLDKNPEER